MLEVTNPWILSFGSAEDQLWTHADSLEIGVLIWLEPTVIFSKLTQHVPCVKRGRDGPSGPHEKEETKFTEMSAMTKQLENFVLAHLSRDCQNPSRVANAVACLSNVDRFKVYNESR